MNYRMAVPSDFPQLAQMRWDFRVELDPGRIPPEMREGFLQSMMEFLPEAYASGKWGIWLAEEDGVVISHVYIQRIRKVPRPFREQLEWGYLTNMFTYPEYRGRGIGAELLRQAVDWGRSIGLEMIILWPAKGREEFYIRGGFEHEKEAMTQEFQLQ